MMYVPLILSTFDNISRFVEQIRIDKIKAGWKLIQPALKLICKPYYLEDFAAFLFSMNAVTSYITGVPMKIDA